MFEALTIIISNFVFIILIIVVVKNSNKKWIQNFHDKYKDVSHGVESLLSPTPHKNTNTTKIKPEPTNFVNQQNTPDSVHLFDGILQNGKYRVIRPLACGGFGNTYEGELILLHKKVAIKEFFVKDFCNREEGTGYVTVATQNNRKLIDRLKLKFLEEASALYSMKHKNIVRVTDVFEENETAYYVMDFVDGESLHDKVRREGALSESQAVFYIKQVADALRYVHSQNRLHLDVKPGNIMIDQCNNVYLIDFGASKQYEEKDGENTSTLLGQTPGYSSLEQIGNDVATFTPATDIYSLGATLYKLVTGITPPSASLLAGGEEINFHIPISATTRTAILQSMQANKRIRPQSIDEFIALLNGQTISNSEDTLIN